MAEFIGANLLSSFQKKMFPDGVGADVSQRLSSLEFYQAVAPDKVEMFSKQNTFASTAFNLYKTYDFTDPSQLQAACQSAKMKVQIDSQETKYVADPDQTGSMTVYKFTDRRGNTVQINNINTQQYIQREQSAVDDILQGVLDDVISGTIDIAQYEEALKDAA